MFLYLLTSVVTVSAFRALRDRRAEAVGPFRRSLGGVRAHPLERVQDKELAAEPVVADVCADRHHARQAHAEVHHLQHEDARLRTERVAAVVRRSWSKTRAQVPETPLNTV